MLELNNDNNEEQKEIDNSDDENYVYPYEYVNETSGCEYAIYQIDAPPDEIAFNGSCFIYCKPDGFFSDDMFISDILTNPTYLQLLHIADKAIETTHDFHHRFFEGVHILKQINANLWQIELMMGS